MFKSGKILQYPQHKNAGEDDGTYVDGYINFSDQREKQYPHLQLSEILLQYQLFAENGKNALIICGFDQEKNLDNRKE